MNSKPKALILNTANNTGQIPVHAAIPMFAPSPVTNPTISSLRSSSSVNLSASTGTVPILLCVVKATT